MKKHQLLCRMMLLSAVVLLLWRPAEAAQGSGVGEHIGGYARTVSGSSMTYSSPISTARNALIARASDGTSSIIWETDPVPATSPKGTAAFLWLAGLGANLGEKRFTLAVDGKEAVTFTTSSRDSWRVAGKHGASLDFHSVLVDRNHDLFGFMRLTLPETLVQAGKPVTLRITGEAAGSSAWVMTFTTRLTDGVTATCRPVILRDKGTSVQPLDLEIINVGEATDAVLSITGQPVQKLRVPFGITRHAAKLVPVTKSETLQVQLEMHKNRTVIPAIITPVRPWTIYLVQHTHTDIGYTRPQTEILAEHLRYIDYALDYCDQTDAYPDDAKFRWTCETSWAVREYLKSRPAAQIARLKKRVLEGRIEVTGMLLNWAEVADENALVHSLEPIKMCRDLGHARPDGNAG